MRDLRSIIADNTTPGVPNEPVFIGTWGEMEARAEVKDKPAEEDKPFDRDVVMAAACGCDECRDFLAYLRDMGD